MCITASVLNVQLERTNMFLPLCGCGANEVLRVTQMRQTLAEYTLADLDSTWVIVHWLIMVRLEGL